MEYYKVNVAGYNPAYFKSGRQANELYKDLLRLYNKGKLSGVSIQKVKRNQYIKDYFRFACILFLQ